MPQRKRYMVPEKELILRFYLDRVPIKQIAYVFGCSYSYPTMLAKRAGCSRRQRFRVRRDWLLVFTRGRVF